MLKQILIPVAAFAVTATSAAAFGGGMDWSELDIDLSDKEITALEEAREIREEGRGAARVVLEEAGIDEERMREIHDARNVVREEHRAAMDTILEAGDYDAFLEAVEGTPLADVITSESDFEKFAAAHELRQAGDRDGAQELMEEFGLERPAGKMGGRGGRKNLEGFGGPGLLGEGRLSAETE